MNLYELTVQAEQNINKYKHPNLNEWEHTIDPILKAAGENTISKDHIDCILVGPDIVHIQTSYTVRGCEQTQYIELPIAILKADNPLQAATLYRLEKELNDAKRHLSAAETDVINWQKRIDALLNEWL